MTKRARRGRTGWSWAVVGSLVVHAGLLAGLLGFGAERGAPPAPEPVVVDLAEPTAFAWDALPHALAEDLPDPPIPGLDQAVVARPLDAPEGERDNAVARTVAPREGDSRDRAAPAPDSGEDGGRLRAPATRRDRSTLQSRVADTNDEAHPSRLRTSHRSASPQAVRREAKTGVGDSVRTTEATRAPSAAENESPPGPAADPDVTGPAAGAKEAARLRELVLARASVEPNPARGVGPLAAERGARSFDVEAPGRAADDHTVRAASSATRLGLTDYSRAGVAAALDARDGRGPSSAPGAVARATNGAAPAVFGARSPQELAADVAERTRERLYDRYRQEIQRRIQNVLVFPRALAIRLEQGEAVVTFVVRADGWLGDGPRIVKSSGFQEFDAEAVKAVLRAAPFPRRPESGGLSLIMPVTFENPLVR